MSWDAVIQSQDQWAARVAGVFELQPVAGACEQSGRVARETMRDRTTRNSKAMSSVLNEFESECPDLRVVDAITQRLCAEAAKHNRVNRACNAIRNKARC